MESQGTLRVHEIQGQITRLEEALTQSPDDAFGYLELGCLFSEVSAREAALEAFRSSYRHRTGGQVLQPGTGPLINDQLREAFEVAVGQVSEEHRGMTRQLFEDAVRQQEMAEAKPVAGLVAGAVLVIMATLAMFAGPAPTVATHQYWPSFSYQNKAWDLPPGSSGYWPDLRP